MEIKQVTDVKGNPRVCRLLRTQTAGQTSHRPTHPREPHPLGLLNKTSVRKTDLITKREKSEIGRERKEG